MRKTNEKSGDEKKTHKKSGDEKKTHEQSGDEKKTHKKSGDDKALVGHGMLSDRLTAALLHPAMTS